MTVEAVLPASMYDVGIVMEITEAGRMGQQRKTIAST